MVKLTFGDRLARRASNDFDASQFVLAQFLLTAPFVVMKFVQRKLSVCAFAALLIAGMPLAAAEPLADPGDPTLIPRERLQALVERMRLAAQERETMSAAFVQTKESSLLLAPSVSKGTFSYLAPDRVRWEYERPEAMTLVIDQGEALTWYRDLGKAERYQVGRQSERVLEYLGASSSMEQLIEFFRISMQAQPAPGDPYWLRLEPRYSRIAKRLKELELWIDAERFVPVRLRYVEPDGDVTEYVFTDLEINQEISPSLFEVELPVGVAVRDVDLPRRTGSR